MGSSAQPAAAPAAEDKVDIPAPEAETLERKEDKSVAPPTPSGPTPEEQEIRDDIMARRASLETANLYDLLGPTSTRVAPKSKKPITRWRRNTIRIAITRHIFTTCTASWRSSS